MASFWLGQYSLDAPATATGSAAQPILASDVSALAIEVIEHEGDFAVLISTVASTGSPKRLACRIGFANGAQASNGWRDEGFPVVDATIDYQDGKLSVRSPHFAKDQAMQYEQEILTISDIQFGPDDPSNEALTTHYEQSLSGPDYIAPATSVLVHRIRSTPERSQVRRIKSIDFTLGLAATRYPSLLPLQNGPLTLRSAWAGLVDPPEKWRRTRFNKARAERASRADTFGVPAFRFDDVDVIGFRVDLDPFQQDYEKKLQQLIAPLNFHLEPAKDRVANSREAFSTFRYVPATSTLIIELLRYGKMRLKVAESPLDCIDYQSQHELLVRLLVGRIDDDTAQARDPAVFVPAIFVDNPWSKILGREFQGFDKRLADFCAYRGKDDPTLQLLPDGRVKGKEDDLRQRPLTDVARISLVERIGSKGFGPTLMDLKYSQPNESGLDAFTRVDLDLALGSSALSLTRWRQDDFTDAEFRRSFARSLVKKTLKGFRSIQVSPIGKRGGPKTWVTGTFEVDDTVKIAWPAGVANLTLYAKPSAPEGWLQTCDLLGIAADAQETLSFPRGSWYRLNSSMELTIDDGLE